MLPGTVKIGAAEWKVVRSPLLRQDDHLGSCYDETQEIHIASHLEGSAADEAFIHELLHACCRFAGVNPNEETVLTEEDFVARLSPILHTVLKENALL